MHRGILTVCSAVLLTGSSFGDSICLSSVIPAGHTRTTVAPCSCQCRSHITSVSQFSLLCAVREQAFAGLTMTFAISVAFYFILSLPCTYRGNRHFVRGRGKVRIECGKKIWAFSCKSSRKHSPPHLCASRSWFLKDFLTFFLKSTKARLRAKICSYFLLCQIMNLRLLIHWQVPHIG